AIVATPPRQHGAPATWAIENGIGLLVEKPFTCSITEAVRLIAQAEAKTVPVVVGQNYRYRPDIAGAKKLIDDDALGEIGMVSGTYFMATDDSPAATSLDPHRILWG
ncbi:MAG: Gfo/Idh/MocA family protein, partial [Acidimicrobiia bacterium]